jgi:competence protein ComEC
MSFRNNAILWEHAPALRVLIPLIIGIILYDQGHTAIAISGTTVAWITIFFAGIMAGTYFFRKSAKFQLLLVQVFFVWMGLALCYLSDDTHHPRWVGRSTDSSKQLIGIIREQPLQKLHTTKMEVAALAVLGSEGTEAVSGNAIVYRYKAEGQERLNKGDTILIANKWEPVSSTGNPFGLNYPEYCRRKNIHLQQFTDRVWVWGRQSHISLPERLRQRSLAIIARYIQDSVTAALLDAMLLGDERNIDPDTRQVYSDTGIIHIVSVSGAHIAILFFVISYGFSRLGQKKNHWIRYGLTIGLIWFYVSVAGMSIPAIRAATMFTFLAVGNMIGRQHNSLNQLCMSAVIMLLIQPMWLFGIGFQLSFAAVLSMILFYKPILSLWPVKHKILSFFTQTIAASIAAEILVAPLVAYYFHSFPLMFIVANLVAGLAMSLILCLGLLLLILGNISLIAQALAFLIVVISDLFHYFIYLLDKVDLRFFKTIFISPLLLTVLYLLVFSVCMLRKSRSAVWISLCCLLTLSILNLLRAVQVSTQRRLIVFHEKGKAHTELLQGAYYHLLRSTPSDSYGVNLAHIGFGANRAGSGLTQNVLSISGKRIVLADSTLVLTDRFPADILLIQSASPAMDATLFLRLCTPRLVVLAAGSRIQAMQWEKMCREQNVAFHSVRAQGTFIFP